ncbi:MAG: hypothetical protein M1818_004348 [Claussenomyces sp. TS43310]|nr:MAG: hypothetical protein M1818_004348 [Claussenomyces sp. TS43310]
MKRSAAQMEFGEERAVAIAAGQDFEKLSAAAQISPSNMPGNTGAMNGHVAESGEDVTSVLIVGAGPAGLMLGMTLARFGIDVRIVDDRADKTSTGRADGLQPKTIETLKQLRLADDLLRKGVKVYDICFWESSSSLPLSRASRSVHYPAQVDTLDPYILLVHQGMIEDIFLDDLRTRGVDVTRSSPFISCTSSPKGSITSSCSDVVAGGTKTFHSNYLAGCDGAHSMVRRAIPSVSMVGESGKAAWGVLDGVISTDFPDIWSKTAIHSHTAGSILCIPRERNMTRFYIELHPGTTQPLPGEIANQEFVMQRAKEIMAPFKVKWETVEWFSVYRVGQRVASSFTSPDQKVFITGDAAHTHSPKAAQGMNVSMHDSFNLGWKMALSARGLALPSLLATYEQERRLIAQQLINFDYEHANAFLNGDSAALTKNFDDNIRFISGVGAEYGDNVLNWPQAGLTLIGGTLKAGALMPPAKVSRYIDANPIDVQLDIPTLSQFRIYFMVADVHAVMKFLTAVTTHISSEVSVLGRASRKADVSYAEMQVRPTESDDYLQPGRYRTVSKLFTPALITPMDKGAVEISHLPDLLRRSPWTFYIDDVAPGRASCTEKWLGGLGKQEAAIVNVRPDGYVGSVGRWKAGEEVMAEKWLDAYYGGFLNV